MDSLKIILLLSFMILSRYVRESKSRDFNAVKHKKLTIFDNKEEANAASASECFCFPKNPQGKHVSEHISPNGELQKRLVVYLFKNQNNNITIYVPNKQKQSFLPDLTLDEDDQLGPLNTENVIDLYNINSKVTIDSKNAQELNLGKLFIEPLSPEIYHSHKSIDLESLQAFLPEIFNSDTIHLDNEDSLKQVDMLRTKPGKKLHIHVEKEFPSINDLIFPGDLIPLAPEISETTQDIHKNIHIMKPSGSDHLSIHPTDENGMQEDDDIRVTISKIPDSSESDSQVNMSTIENKPTHLHLHTENDKIPESSNFIVVSETEKNQARPKLLLQVKPINQPSEQHPNAQDGKYVYVIGSMNGRYIPFSENSYNYIDTNEIEKSWTKVHKQPPSSSLELTLAIPHLPGKHIDNKILPPLEENSAQNIILVLPENEVNIQPKFKQWFQEQIELIGKKILSLSQDINQSKFKILLLKVLQKNGFSLSESGDLIDLNGNILDITNLKLVPILLRYPSEYNKSIARKKCCKSYDLSYLEAVLVTQDYPSKILGIIPLETTLKEATDGNKQHCSLNEHCSVAKINKKKPSCKGKCEIKNIKDKKTTVKESKKLNTLEKGKYELSSKNLKSEIKGKPLLGSFINPRLGDVVSENDILIKDKQILKDIDVPEDWEIEDTDEDYESLGLKIIGGQAATSSGTPVKNRGRSADFYSF